MADKFRRSTEYTNEMRRFAQFVYAARLENTVDGKIETSTDVSKKLNVNFSEFEQQIRMPVLDTVIRICRYYGISLDRFFRLGRFKEYEELPVKSFEKLRELDPNRRKRKIKINEEMREFLRLFRDRRISTGKSIKDISPLVGISRTVLSGIERGAQLPSREKLISLCKFYGLSESDIPSI